MVSARSSSLGRIVLLAMLRSSMADVEGVRVNVLPEIRGGALVVDLAMMLMGAL